MIYSCSEDEYDIDPNKKGDAQSDSEHPLYGFDRFGAPFSHGFNLHVSD